MQLLGLTGSETVFTIREGDRLATCVHATSKIQTKQGRNLRDYAETLLNLAEEAFPEGRPSVQRQLWALLPTAWRPIDYG